jgi:hypothetical protein
MKENFSSARWWRFAASAIPDALPPLDYFLKPIDTPQWHWGFRLIFALCFLSVMAAFVYHSLRPTVIKAVSRHDAPTKAKAPAEINRSRAAADMGGSN